MDSDLVELKLLAYQETSLEAVQGAPLVGVVFGSHYQAASHVVLSCIRLMQWFQRS